MTSIVDTMADMVTSLPGEKLVFATRQHVYVLIRDIALLLVLSLALCSMLLFLFQFLYPNLSLFLAGVALVMSISYALITKSIIDWYAHIYVVTNRKILELCCDPLFSYRMNDILLDRVRYTEIDVESNGILKEILNMGNITVTFDRPTHQEEFVFVNIEGPHRKGLFLNQILDIKTREQEHAIWYPLKTRMQPSY